MTAKANYFRLGLFMLVGLGVLLAIVVALGAGSFFKKKMVMETYFDSTVQGLDIGSAVKYRGVTVGKVSGISFTYTRYEQDKPLPARKHYVLVTADVEPALIGLGPADIQRQTLKRQIDLGLRIRNTLQGVTGIYFLEVDYVNPERNPPLAIDWVPDNLYVPSARGLVDQITNFAEALARRLEQIDIEGLVQKVGALTVTADRLLTQLPVEKLGLEAAQLLAELRTTNRHLQRAIGDADALINEPALKTVPGDVSAAARDAAAAAAQLRQLADSERLQATLDQGGQLVQRLNRLVGGDQDNISATMDNLRQLSENLRILTEELKRNPSQILRGEPPARTDQSQRK